MLVLMGEEGSEQGYSQAPRVGTLLIKTCFLQHSLLGRVSRCHMAKPQFAQLLCHS